MKYTLELQEDGEFYSIWLNNEDGTAGATVAENIGEERLGRIMVDALNKANIDI